MDVQALLADVIRAGKATADQRSDYLGWVRRGGFRARVTVTGWTDPSDGRPGRDVPAKVVSLRVRWADVVLDGQQGVTSVRISSLAVAS
jgi:hypothetical protein